ncbi:hypothetical protein [Streptomyces sp. NPDC052127]|uniref:hypothetical protein n=1 Tax=Streptomyces sp. NPDC052127 TaxID=3155679 RepID=UPI00342490CC
MGGPAALSGCPVHARLVAEWRADGRTVPTRWDLRWLPSPSGSPSVRLLRREEHGTFRP